MTLTIVILYSDDVMLNSSDVIKLWECWKQYFILILMFKCMNGLALTTLNDNLNFVNNSHSYVTIASVQNDLTLPKPNCEIPLMWNSLPCHIRNISDIIQFKNIIKNYVMPCDIAACITYLVSHSSSLSYNTVIKKIFQVGCIINTKLPSCVDIIRRTSLGFPSWCPESTRPTDSCFHGTSCENLTMYGGLYQHTRLVLYLYSLTFLFLIRAILKNRVYTECLP